MQASAPLGRNIELKARLASLAAARGIAASLATERLPDQHQIDTYFGCSQGRLKLREINDQRAELIWYERPDQTAAKASAYRLVPVADPAELKAALAGACGIRTVVDKHREIYLFHNVRIHLDRVVGLGEFLEFEAVLGDGVDAAHGTTQVAMLQHRFGLSPADLLTGSYADLLIGTRSSRDE